MATALPNGMTSSVRSFFARRQFGPRIVPTLAMILFVAITISLGNWQRHRAEEKDALAAQLAAASREPPVDLPAGDDAALALRFRAVRAIGQYDAVHQILIDNKVRAGRAGFDVVAPLKLGESGRYVLVDRGWIAQGASRRDLPQVPVPPGNMTVTGRVNLPPQRYLELAREHAPGPLWENLDVRRIAAATGLDLLPIVVEQMDPVAPSDALKRDWPPPDFGSQQNFSYMLQWYSFATLAFVLWLALNWRRRGSRDGG
jgi:surfeit locus 1 family protein